jgi:hypothetical protein
MLVGKHSEIVVFKGDKIISKNRFDLPDGEEALPLDFPRCALKYHPIGIRWMRIMKAKTMADGISCRENTESYITDFI